jgi:hypothetical protein
VPTAPVLVEVHLVGVGSGRKRRLFMPWNRHDQFTFFSRRRPATKTKPTIATTPATSPIRPGAWR